MDIADLAARQAKNLIAVCIERGLSAPFCDADIDECLNDTLLDDSAKLRMLNRMHGAIHEVLYSPPNRG